MWDEEAENGYKPREILTYRSESMVKKREICG